MLHKQEDIEKIDSFAYHACDMLNHNHKQKIPQVNEDELSPTTISTAATINNYPTGHLMKTLFDTGGSVTVIQRRVLPTKCVPLISKKNLLTQTTSGIVKL